MDQSRINRFLRGLIANNNGDWMNENKAEYTACRNEFISTVDEIIHLLTPVSPEIGHQQAKDCVYRINRDIRFSKDKSPYKRYFSCYISSHGRKSLRGGYYLQIMPGNSIIALGPYYLEKDMLTSCRNDIMNNIDEWRKMTENKKFVDYFGRPGEGLWSFEEASEKGFGLACLKKAPVGFPKDFPYMQYLRLKDYLGWVKLQDDFFEQEGWQDNLLDMAETYKPVMDFTNAVIDDYI